MFEGFFSHFYCVFLIVVLLKNLLKTAKKNVFTNLVLRAAAPLLLLSATFEDGVFNPGLELF